MPGSTSSRRSMKRLGVFSFSDGLGIASANLDRVFDSFFSTKNA
jgi:hypothetical protein